MTVLQALLLGLVEGITAYLPVSSTGQLILAPWLVGLGPSRETWDHAFTFNIVIQAGAIAAVLGLYLARCAQMLAGLVGRDPAGLRLGLQLLVAFLPAAACGLLFKDMIRAHLNGPWPVVAARFGGGLLMLWVARRGPGKGRGLGDLSFRDAILIGACQTLALWPGTSRSMMAILPEVKSSGSKYPLPL